MEANEVLMLIGILAVLYVLVKLWKAFGLQILGCGLILLFVLVVVGTFVIHLLGF
ncbi:MAG: hypothetical protein U0641_05790 [Anaerolineae bacterium]